MGVLLPVFLPVLVFSILFIHVVLTYSAKRVFGPGKTTRKRGLKVFGKTASKENNCIETAEEDVEARKGPRQPQPTLEFKSFDVRWEGISSALPKKKGGRTILQGCAGVVRPGQLAAIVGPSGAGKTALLDTLAMRRPATTGTVLIGGQPQTERLCKQISTYIQQDDAFVPTLCVRETLQMHATLRLPRAVGKADREGMVQDLLNSMGLEQVQENQVGGLLPGGLVVRGLSGGEKRRLSIACGVIAQPAIIFADEPTSGLDSHAALVVMQHLRKLSAAGRTVICSIHQPRQAIWDMFDVVEVLSEGRLMYFGPKSLALRWFTIEMDYEYDPNRSGSPADWLLDLVSVNFADQGCTTSETMTSEEEVVRAANLFAAEQLARNMGRPAGPPDADCEPTTSGQTPQECGRYQASWCTQLRILSWRAFLAYTRNPADVAGRMMMAQGVAIMDGVVIMSGGNKGGYNINNAISVVTCIFTVTFTLLLLPFTHMSLYVSDRKFYALDVAANLYWPSAYYVGQALAGFPFTILNATVLTLIMYGLIGLRYTARAVLLTMVTVGLLSLVGVQILVLSAYLTSSQDLAFVVAVTYVTWSILLGGFIVRLSDLYTVLRGLSYLFPLRYTFQALVQLQFEGLPTLKVVTEFYDMNWSVGANLAGLVGVLLGLHLLSMAVLHCLHRPFRPRLRRKAIQDVASMSISQEYPEELHVIDVPKDALRVIPGQK